MPRALREPRLDVVSASASSLAACISRGTRGALCPPLRFTSAANPGAGSTWSNQSKPISLTMRLLIMMSRASSVAKCWCVVNGGM